MIDYGLKFQCEYFHNLFYSKDAINSNYKCTSHKGMSSAHYFGKIRITSKLLSCVRTEKDSVRTASEQANEES